MTAEQGNINDIGPSQTRERFLADMNVFTEGFTSAIGELRAAFSRLSEDEKARLAGGDFEVLVAAMDTPREQTTPIDYRALEDAESEDQR